MNMLSNEKINFKSLEENTFKEMMKLGREIIQEELRMLDKLILDYRDKEVFEPKDFQPTTIKTKLGEIPIARRRYKMAIKGKVKMIYLLDEYIFLKFSFYFSPDYLTHILMILQLFVLIWMIYRSRKNRY